MTLEFKVVTALGNDWNGVYTVLVMLWGFVLF